MIHLLWLIPTAFAVGMILALVRVASAADEQEGWRDD